MSKVSYPKAHPFPTGIPYSWGAHTQWYMRLNTPNVLVVHLNSGKVLPPYAVAVHETMAAAGDLTFAATAEFE